MRKAPEGKAYVQTVQEIMGLNLGSTHTNRYSGIVEAQSSSTGITNYRSADYKSIVSIRRFT